jgi:hypothetical protein
MHVSDVPVDLSFFKLSTICLMQGCSERDLVVWYCTLWRNSVALQEVVGYERQESGISMHRMLYCVLLDLEGAVSLGSPS